jgi:putative flavoprotein involved in K+ transport
MTSLELDVLIIGAGQAGLAVGYHLKSTPLRFQLLERHTRIGQSWRNRYDSLTLFTPRRYSSLPGLALTGEENGYAARDEFADYLETYTARFELPVMLGQQVIRLERRADGFYATTHTGYSFTAQAVVLANGAFQTPKIPTLAQRFSPTVRQFTAETYRNPSQIAPGTVLIVGDGATGRDIAKDLAPTHRVILATGRRPRRLFPETIFGKSTWWWLNRMGLLQVSASARLGKLMRRADPFPARGNRLRDLRQQGVRIMPHLEGADGTTAQFADGTSQSVDAIVWATGYRDDSDWVASPDVKDTEGNFVHREGISPVPGLYFIGRSWQRTRSSALVGGVGEDARWLVDVIVKQLSSNHAVSGNASQERSPDFAIELN